MKKKIKIIAIVVGIALLIGLLVFANALVGNPISKFLVNKSAEQYVEENYGDLNLVREDARFNFKNGDYFIKLYSETVEDLYFSLDYSQFGQLQRDLYENNITEGWNVMSRISNEYHDQTEAFFELLKKEGIFKGGEHFYSSGWLTTKQDIYEFSSFPVIENGGIDSTKLELDKEYDVSELGSYGGMLDVSVSFADLDTSYERGAEGLLEIKEAFDKKGMGFLSITFAVFNSEGNHAYYIENLLYEDIYEEGLAERMEKAENERDKSYDK